jgi:hypothetical protein
MVQIATVSRNSVALKPRTMGRLHPSRRRAPRRHPCQLAYMHCDPFFHAPTHKHVRTITLRQIPITTIIASPTDPRFSALMVALTGSIIILPRKDTWTAFPRTDLGRIVPQILWRGRVTVRDILSLRRRSHPRLSRIYRTSWTRRNSQPGSGASVPAAKRVHVRLAYSTEARSHGLVGKPVQIQIHVTDVCNIPRFLHPILLPRRRRHPKMDAYPSSLNH